MSKRKDLRSKLKASDRRRRRRPVAEVEPSASDSTNDSVDVTALVLDAILSGDDVRSRDATALAALRSCLTGLPPNSETASELFGRLQQIAQRDDVGRRAFRRSIEQVLSLAERRGPDQDSLTSYLQLFVS